MEYLIAQFWIKYYMYSLSGFNLLLIQMSLFNGKEFKQDLPKDLYIDGDMR